MLNEIFKPVFAADRLRVLRRQHEFFEILLYPDDLKVLTSKEKRQELLQGVPPEELLTPPASLDQQPSNEPDTATAVKKKKKKRSTLSNTRQASSSQADLSWLTNTETNRQLKRGDSSKLGGASLIGQATASWCYKLNSELTSLDDVYERFHHGYYHSLEAIEEALGHVFARAEQRCLNTLARNYIDKVKTHCLSLLKRRSELKSKWLSYFTAKFDLTARQ